MTTQNFYDRPNNDISVANILSKKSLLNMKKNNQAMMQNSAQDLCHQTQEPLGIHKAHSGHDLKSLINSQSTLFSSKTNELWRAFEKNNALLTSISNENRRYIKNNIRRKENAIELLSQLSLCLSKSGSLKTVFPVINKLNDIYNDLSDRDHLFNDDDLDLFQLINKSLDNKSSLNNYLMTFANSNAKNLAKGLNLSHKELVELFSEFATLNIKAKDLNRRKELHFIFSEFLSTLAVKKHNSNSTKQQTVFNHDNLINDQKQSNSLNKVLTYKENALLKINYLSNDILNEALKSPTNLSLALSSPNNVLTAYLRESCYVNNLSLDMPSCDEVNSQELLSALFSLKGLNNSEISYYLHYKDLLCNIKNKSQNDFQAPSALNDLSEGKNPTCLLLTYKEAQAIYKARQKTVCYNTKYFRQLLAHFKHLLVHSNKIYEEKSLLAILNNEQSKFILEQMVHMYFQILADKELIYHESYKLPKNLGYSESIIENLCAVIIDRALPAKPLMAQIDQHNDFIELHFFLKKSTDALGFNQQHVIEQGRNQSLCDLTLHKKLKSELLNKGKKSIDKRCSSKGKITGDFIKFLSAKDELNSLIKKNFLSHAKKEHRKNLHPKQSYYRDNLVNDANNFVHFSLRSLMSNKVINSNCLRLKDEDIPKNDPFYDILNYSQIENKKLFWFKHQQEKQNAQSNLDNESTDDYNFNNTLHTHKRSFNKIYNRNRQVILGNEGYFYNGSINFFLCLAIQDAFCHMMVDEEYSKQNQDEKNTYNSIKHPKMPSLGAFIYVLESLEEFESFIFTCECGAQNLICNPFLFKSHNSNNLIPTCNHCMKPINFIKDTKASKTA